MKYAVEENAALKNAKQNIFSFKQITVIFSSLCARSYANIICVCTTYKVVHYYPITFKLKTSIDFVCPLVIGRFVMWSSFYATARSIMHDECTIGTCTCTFHGTLPELNITPFRLTLTKSLPLVHTHKYINCGKLWYATLTLRI